MSRPQKIHPPIKGDFNNILAAVAAGNGVVKTPTHKPVGWVKKSKSKKR